MKSIAPVIDPRPMMEMNTTPLIDVMLVLLIMFILSIPLQTHAVKLDVPTCSTCPKPDSKRNTVVITKSGAILWNGYPVDSDGLRFMLQETRRIRPAPELHLQPQATARYELVDEVLAITKKSGVKKMGFIGNEAYRDTF